MAEQEKVNEKRRVTTFFRPELLQIFLPLLLAAGSGFLMHDREISTLKTQVEVNSKAMEAAVSMTSELISLRDRVERMEHERDEIEHLNDEISKMLAAIQQQSEYRDEQLKEYRNRIRQLEREVDKLTK